MPGVADHLGPLRRLGRDHGGKLGRRVADHLDAELLEALAHVRQREDAHALAMQLLDDVRGVPAGAIRPNQAVESKSGNPASIMVGRSGTDGHSGGPR